MRKPKTPQDVQEQIERIANAIDKKVDWLTDERERLCERMHNLRLIANRTKNPHALIPSEYDSVEECIICGGTWYYFNNIFDLREWQYKLAPGCEECKWKLFHCRPLESYDYLRKEKTL